MSKGPQGQKRSAEVVGCAVEVARIASGEAEDTRLKHPAKRKAGQAGAKAHSAMMSILPNS